MLIYVDRPRRDCRERKIAERARSTQTEVSAYLYSFSVDMIFSSLSPDRFLLAPAHADALGNSRSRAIDPRSMLMHTGSSVGKRSSSSILINGFRDRVREPSASIPSAQSAEQELSSESLLKSHLHFLI